MATFSEGSHPDLVPDNMDRVTAKDASWAGDGAATEDIPDGRVVSGCKTVVEPLCTMKRYTSVSARGVR